jgi:hypothetical protein
MGKKSIIEELRAHGAVAAHPNDRWVTVVKGSPKQVTMANPLYMDKKKISVGDKIAIVDTHDYATAFICRVSKVESGRLSKAETLELSSAKEIELS